MDLLPKQIIAWADTQPMWRRDLLRRVAAAPLIPDEEAQVLALLLSEPGGPDAVALSESDLPSSGATEETIRLEGLRDVVGVNALAKESNLRFAVEGLTVVFGNCGAGKSGFSRVLACVCRASVVPELHPNAFEHGSPRQSARLKLRRGDGPVDHRQWLDEEPPTWLAAVEVFDSECAEAIVTKGETIEYTPPSLRVLTRCSDAQKKLAGILAARADALAVPVAVDASTDVEALVQASKLDEAELAELDQLTERLALLESDKAPAAIAAARAAAESARSVAKSIDKLAADLGEQIETVLAGQRQAVADAETAVVRMRQEMEQPGLRAGTGGEQWRVMWEAARSFVANEFPPAEGDSCPLCQQSVDARTADRLARLEAFVVSDLQQRLDKARGVLQMATQGLPNPEGVKTTSVAELALLGEPTREEVLAVIDSLAERRNALASGASAAGVPVAAVLAELEAFAAAQGRRAEQLTELHDGAKTDQAKKRASALASRRAIVEQAETIRERCRLLRAIKELDTGVITRGHNTLAKTAINDRLVDEVGQELEALNGPGSDVHAITSGASGQTVLRVKLRGSAMRPGWVLSEGEKRLVSLAIFFAQLTVRGGDSAIVLDDPVRSLDGPWQEAVAARLAREAQRRQVIVFTHAMGFSRQLSGSAQERNVACEHRYITKEGKRAGVISQEPPWSRVPFSDRPKELRRRLDDKLIPLWTNNQDQYERDAETWMTYLRRTWELLVEERVFNGTVRRDDPRIHMRKLKDVRFPDGLGEKISAGFSRTSDKAHEAAEDLAYAHRPDVLRSRLDDLDAVIAELDQEGAQAKASNEQEAQTAAISMSPVPAPKRRQNGGGPGAMKLFEADRGSL